MSKINELMNTSNSEILVSVHHHLSDEKILPRGYGTNSRAAEQDALTSRRLLGKIPI